MNEELWAEIYRLKQFVRELNLKMRFMQERLEQLESTLEKLRDALENAGIDEITEEDK